MFLFYHFYIKIQLNIMHSYFLFHLLIKFIEQEYFRQENYKSYDAGHGSSDENCACGDIFGIASIGVIGRASEIDIDLDRGIDRLSEDHKSDCKYDEHPFNG